MPKRFDTFYVPFGLQGLDRSLYGLKLALVGDLHEQTFGQNNCELADAIVKESPDYIVCTGDMLDRHTRDGKPFLSLLCTLAGRFPVIFCPGNHEVDVREHDRPCYNTFLKEIKAFGVQVLENEQMVIRREKGNFALYGLVTRGNKQQPNLEYVTQHLGTCREDMPALVLCHDPAWFPVLAEWGAKGVLSGHIHGGLIRLGGSGGLLAPGMRLLPRYDAGLFEQKDCRLYVTRGFGDSFLHFRCGVERELAILTLTGEEAVRPKPKSRVHRAVLGLLSGLAAAALVLLFFWSLLPVFAAGITHIGVWAPALLSLVWLFFLLGRGKIARIKRGKGKIPFTIFQWCVALGTAGVVVLFSCMAFGALTPPRPGSTVVVLGTQVRGSVPSLSLQRRLDKAVEYLNSHPEAPCIVSGGQGPGEDISEAEAMYRYLVRRGIEENRIYKEDRSVNTAQNLAYSAQIIRKEGLPGQVAIVTERFHELRGGLEARRNGLEAGAVPCESAWFFRECFAIINALVFGG